MPLPTPTQLRQAREHAGVSLAACGAALGITRQAYERRENGLTALQPDDWATLERLFAEAIAAADGPVLTLPEQLRGARAWARKTTTDCAEAIGTWRDAYRERELGRRATAAEELDRLAALYGRPRAELFRLGGRRGPKPAVPPGSVAGTLLEELRYWRGVADLSLEQAGAVIGVSREGYRQREEGIATVSGAELALLAQAYGRPLFRIFRHYQPSEGELELARALAETGRV